MSEPSYRITTEHKFNPQYPNIPWEARVVRVSDGEPIGTQYGGTEARAIEQAQQVIRGMMAAPQSGRVLFADENGEITHGGVPAPESLRVS